MTKTGVGILGFGTVGAGVAEGLLRNRATLAQRLGVEVELKKIADLDTERDRGVKLPEGMLVRDAAEVIADPDISIVVELIGGTKTAADFILRAIAAGKHVVTANKALLAERGAEIFEAAGKAGVDVYFGASVGGGIPIVRVLREGLAGNEIERIDGILNGTCNYILTRMGKERIPFDAALADAQCKGYAEADPSLDIDGWDTAHKAILLASLAYGFYVPKAEVDVTGIRRLSSTDVQYADRLGYCVKLLARIERDGEEVEVDVGPALVPAGHMLASVSGVFNAVMVHGDLVDDMLLYGRGAGRAPTASTVIGDIGDVARNIAGGSPRYRNAISTANAGHLRVKPRGEVRSEFYIRLMVKDAPGTFGCFGTIFGKHGVSIRTASSFPFVPGSEILETIPVVIETHPARRADLEAALAEIKRSGVVRCEPVAMRIV